jgi:hypothetical protein
MARPPPSVLCALLLAGCTGKNPDYGGVVDRDAHAEHAGGAPGSGGGASSGGAPGLGGDPSSATGGSGGASDPPAPEDAADAPEPQAEVAPPIEAPPEAPAELCGTDRPSVANIVEADGLAVALDGTIYYSTSDELHGYVGRLRPQHALEPAWQRLDNQPITWGLALDTARKKLYFASDTTIFGFDLAFDPPLRFPVAAKLTDINDLVVAPDGSLFLTVQSDRFVYRVDPTSSAMAVKVSTTALGTAAIAPAALAFGADGTLFVGMAGRSGIVRIVLDGVTEKSRATFGGFTGWANGLAFDRSGRLYVAPWDDTLDTEITLLSPTGATTGKVAIKGRFASMAFGRGALNCRDLYVASPLGPMTRVETDTPGLPAP